MGNTCKPMADSCQCMTKPLQYCKVISLQLVIINGIKKKKNITVVSSCERKQSKKLRDVATRGQQRLVCCMTATSTKL